MADQPLIVAFEVLLRPSKGRRLPSAATIEASRPDPEEAERCRRWLASRGATCHLTTFGIACSAPAEVFAALFRVRVAPNQERTPGQPTVVISGVIRVPTEIDQLVEQVALSVPPELFG